jgi:hypothetical protein
MPIPPLNRLNDEQMVSRLSGMTEGQGYFILKGTGRG